MYGVLGGASNNDSRPASRADSRPVTPVVVFPAAAAADVQAEVEFLRAETPEPVAAPSAATASINPQRTATASIKLSPAAAAQTPPGSPLVSRVASRARSKSPNPRMSNSRGIKLAPRIGPATAANRPARPGPNRPTAMRSISVQSRSNGGTSNGHQNGVSNGVTNGVTNGNSSRSNSSRRPLSAVNNGTSSASAAARAAKMANGGSNTLSVNGGGNSVGYGRSVSADPSLLADPSVQAKLGNRATKVVQQQKSIGKCGMCNKPIQEDGCTAFGKVYHKACFKCHACKQKIQGKFFERGGKPYCEKDYIKLADACSSCGLPVKGDCIESSGKVFHPGCMKCYVCGDLLNNGVFFTWEDKPICERDYKQVAERCAGCGEVPVGKCYSIDDQVFCEECHQKGGEQCPSCNRAVDGHCVRACGSAFHPDCFVCVVCKKKMINLPFVADDKQQIYCTDDYNRKKAPKCSFCKKPIVPKEGQKTAPRLRALGRDYHPQCFQCEDCGLVLDSRVKGKECYPFKNRLYCLKCNRKKLSSEEEEEDDDDDTDENSESQD